MPSLVPEFGDMIPEPLEPYWDWEFCCFHSPQWWRRHWAKTGLVRVDQADLIDDGWRDWHRFNELTLPTATGWFADAGRNTKSMLEADRGRHLGFAWITATKAS